MIKDLLVSFRDNFKEKSTNPFLGTYVFVWAVRNWVLIYTLFNFDNNTKLAEKVDFIQQYYSDNNFYYGVLCNILWALAVLILTYTLLNISRFIVNTSEKRVTPWGYKITDSKSVVLKSVYEQLRNNRDELQLRLEQERDARSKLETQIKSLEDELINLRNNKKNTTNFTESTNEPKLENEVDIIYEKIKNKNLTEKLFTVMDKIRNKNNWFRYDSMPEIEYFIKLGLLTIKSKDSITVALDISPLGDKILRRMNLELL